MNRKIAFHNGLLKHLPLSQALEIAANTGYKACSVWLDAPIEFMGKDDHLNETIRLIQALDLKIIEFSCFKAPWVFATGQAKKAMLEEAKQMCAIAQKIGAPMLCAAALEGDEKGDLKLAIENFKALCDIARDYDLKVGLEFIPWQRIDSVLTAWNMIEAANKENAGMIVDTFLFFKGLSKLEDFDQIPMDKLLLVHMSDFLEADQALDLYTQTVNYRVMPSEGAFDLVSFIKKLDERNYSGYYTLEVFNKDYANQDPIMLAKRAKALLEDVFQKADQI